MKIPHAIAVPLLIVPWCVAAYVFGWVILQRFPPNGVFLATSPLDGKSAFINPFLPAERTTVPGVQPEGWTGQRITDDPVYFTAHIPGPYDSVSVDIDFRPIHQTLLEFGLVRDAAGNDLDLQPFYSSELQNPSWTQVRGGYVSPASTDLSTLPLSQLVTWSSTTTSPLLSDPSGPERSLQTSLRGAHDFYLVPAGGQISLDFGIQDSRRNRASSAASFRIFRGEEEIKREVLVTSGSRDTKMGPVMDHRIVIDHADPGVYHVAFQADDDVFIREIKTTSQHWVIGPRLNFGDVVGYATTTLPGHAWTTSRHLVADTLHVEGEQTVTLGPLRLNLAHTHEVIRFDRTDANSTPVELLAPKGDIRFIGDGWFALQPGAFFEPKPKRFTDGTNLSLEGIHGVLTPYVQPQELGDGWYRAHFTFPLTDPSMDTLRFVLSSPGIASRLGAVDIRNVAIRYERPAMSFRAWFHVLRQELANAWHRIRNS